MKKKNNLSLFSILTIATLTLITSLSATAKADLSNDEALEAALGVFDRLTNSNLVCVDSKGFAYAALYQSQDLTEPAVTLVGGRAKDIGNINTTTILDTMMGPIKLMLPSDISQVSKNDIVANINGIRIAKTTARMGKVKDIQCLYAVTPTTWNMVTFPGGVVLE